MIRLTVILGTVVCSVCCLIGDAGKVQGATVKTPAEDSGEAALVESVVNACQRFRAAALSVESVEAVPSFGNEPAVQAVKQHDFVFGRSRKLFRTLASIERDGERVFLSHEHLVRSDGERIFVQSRLNDGFDSFLDAPHVVLYSDAITSADVQSVTGLLDGFNDVAVAFWYVGYRPVDHYFNEAVHVEEESGEFIIFCSGEFGEAQFRVSESTGYLPRKFNVILRPNASVGEITVGEMLRSFGTVDSMTVTGTISDFQFAPDGTIVPSAIEVQRSISRNYENRKIATTSIRFKSIEFNPTIDDSDFRPRLPLPTDTLAGARGASHLEYTWDGTWVTAKVQPLSDSRILTEGTQGRIGILLVFNLVLVAALLLIVRQRKKNRSRSPSD